MLKGVVTRNDDIWQGHPDVALFNGKLFVVFRVSDAHMTEGKTQIHITSTRVGKSLEFSPPIMVAKTQNRFNCPRLSVIGEWLYIICDEIDASKDYIDVENTEGRTHIWLWKTKNGEEWEGPLPTNISGIVPDRICVTRDGYLIATHIKLRNKLVQNVWFSERIGKEWSRFAICHNKELNLCEASVIRLGKKYLCMMRENSCLGLPSYVCWSTDGIIWGEIAPTRMFGCHRPVTGRLKSGNLLTTYREASHSFKRGYWAKNTFACLSSSGDFFNSIILPLDHDKSRHSDSGYTGWVQLPNQSIFIVNYITNDALYPYISWYIIKENEF